MLINKIRLYFLRKKREALVLEAEDCRDALSKVPYYICVQQITRIDLEIQGLLPIEFMLGARG